MKNRYMAIIAIVLVFMLAFSQAGAAEGEVMSTETKDRIVEQYGLEMPAPAGPDWSGFDVGISEPVELLIMLCRLIVNPLWFAVHEIL